MYVCVLYTLEYYYVCMYVYCIHLSITMYVHESVHNTCGHYVKQLNVLATFS